MKDPKKVRTITVTIKNKQLDALEDLLYSIPTEEEERSYKVQVKKLWHTLIEAYDEKEIKKIEKLKKEYKSLSRKGKEKRKRKFEKKAAKHGWILEEKKPT